MQPIINIALRAVRQAGEHLQHIMERQEYNQASVTDTLENIPRIEQQVHRTLLQTLKKSYHDHYVAELNEYHLEEKPIAWLIQPITNPVAFTKGLPGSLLTLTCLHNGKPEHTVMFDPVTGDEYTASRGDGATLNGRRVRTGDNTKLETTLLSLNLFAAQRLIENHSTADLQKDLLQSVYLCTSNQTPELDLLRVACGKLDGLIDLNLNTHSTSPCYLFCNEAGVLLSDISGTPINSTSKSMVAANPKLFKALIQKLYTYRGRL